MSATLKEADTHAESCVPSCADGDEEEEALAQAASELRTGLVAAGRHGSRLDHTLADIVPELSRNYLQQLLRQGLVRLNGQVVSKPACKVKGGEHITIEIQPTQQSRAFMPQPLALDVVHEDEHLLVLNKTAGLVVHPAAGNWSGTLLNGLLARYPQAAQVPRAGIVHRLDKNTSGLMVVARSRSVMDALIRMIAARQVHRQYLALAWGQWQGAICRSVCLPIGRDPRQRLRMAVVDVGVHPGKPAHTDFEWLDGTAQLCLVRCTLHTGRTHQIRVHMACIGHPLIADSLYGGRPGGGMQRQALHAARLAFVHPVTGAALQFSAPLPADMRQALDTWGLCTLHDEGR